MGVGLHKDKQAVLDGARVEDMVHAIGQRTPPTRTIHVQASNPQAIQDMAAGDTLLQVRALGAFLSCLWVSAKI